MHSRRWRSSWQRLTSMLLSLTSGGCHAKLHERFVPAFMFVVPTHTPVCGMEARESPSRRHSARRYEVVRYSYCSLLCAG